MISIKELELLYSKPDLLNLNNITPFVAHDRAAATSNILNNNHWHDNMIRNVASMVSDGFYDDEIYSITREYTLPGYSHQDTYSEVKKAIDGARAKGFSKTGDIRPMQPLSTSGPLLKLISDGNMAPTEYLVSGLLEEQTISLLFGAPASGKSFIAMHLACSIASGIPFFEREVKTGAVVYVAGEGRRGLRKRAYAWCQKHNSDWGQLSVLLSERSVGILDTSELMSLKDDIDKNIAQHGKPALIIVDTLNRNFGAGDENSNADMGRFIKALEHFQKSYNCSILIVHHSGHSDSGRVRGASALTAAVDAEYCVKMKRGLIELSCTKMKDEEAPSNVYFELSQLPLNMSGVLLGETLAVLELTSKDTAFGNTIPKKYSIGMDALIEAESLNGEQLNKYGPKSVSENFWKSVFFRRCIAETKEAKTKAFSRLKSGLVNDGFVEVNDNYYSRIKT